MARSTRQNKAIRHVMALTNRPLLALEIQQKAQKEVPNLGIATVYRNLKQLVEEGVLSVVLLPGDNPRYEMADHPHHHHFVCESCQKVFDVHACPGSFADLLPPDFSVRHHDLTLYGQCNLCQH